MFEFSIAIPAHDRGENGPKWMSELLDSLERQTFQDFEVVVSDQSKNDNIMNVCKEYDFHFTYDIIFKIIHEKLLLCVWLGDKRVQEFWIELVKRRKRAHS